MMNKRILSFLLALVLVLGVLPTASATENAEPKCSTCGQTDCLGHEEEPAAQAEEAQPQTDAVYCTSCGNVLSDGVGHSEFCRLCKICGVEDCGITHEQCSICSEYDCTKTHAICVTCGNYDCAVDHTPAPSEEETSDCTCNTETETHAESCGLYVAPTQPDAEGEEEGEDEVETEKVCTCGTETETHAETCDLYTAPTQPEDTEEEPKCICTPATDGTHSVECPLYVAPTEPEEETFDVEEAHEYLMSLETKDEIEEYLLSLTEEQATALAETITEEDAMVLGPRLGYEIEYEEYNPIVDYTSVGPLMPPVVVPARTFRLTRSAETTDNGLILSKVATPVDGGYKITLEAYTTGTVTNSTVSVPTDIVLVLDESGSMEDSMYQYEATYEVTQDETYYVKNGDTFTAVNYCDYSDCECWKTGFHIDLLFFNVHYGNEVGDPMTSATDTTEGRVQFYKRDETSTTKRDALEAAATKFVNSVYNDAVANDVDHRISVIGFAGNGNSTIKVGLVDDIRNNRGDTSTNGTVLYAVNNLNANGGTYIEDGLANAETAFDNAAATTSTTRNRVVVVFTDGVPGSGTWSESTISGSANPAIATSKNLKAATSSGGYGATVYTIGMLDDADPTLAVSDENNDAARTNKFLHYLSSNYPNANSMSDGGTGGNNGYYLAASDSDSLNTIFEKIANQISTPTIQLDGDTVIKDIVAPQFDIPAGATINTYTAAYDGENFGARVAESLSTSISGDTVTVTGFNFNDNFISETGRGSNGDFYGKKLIIEFTVTVDADFLGGNGIATNGTDSGVYSDDEIVEAFVVPTADIAVKQIETTTVDQNIYLSNAADIAGLVTGLDSRIDGTNNSHVDITYTIKDAAGGTVATLNIPAGSAAPSAIEWTAAEGALTPVLTEDGVYTITATATPTKTGTATPSTKDATATVKVFLPTVTWQDTVVDYNAVPDFDEENYVDVEWKHVDEVTGTTTLAANVTMEETAPSLTYTYDYEGDRITAETHVKVTSVKANGTDVTNKVTHEHQDCAEENCVWGTDKDNDDCHFIVHLGTFNLTITKNLTKNGVGIEDDSAAFVFNISGNSIDMNVVIYGSNSVTIANLPSGSYTVKEVSGNGRYTLDTSVKTVGPDNNSVEFTNTYKTDKWLDVNDKETNIFKAAGEANS